MLSKQPYKGTRDFFPADKRVQDYLFSHMRRTAESFGYECYDGPLLEEVELYKAKSGEELINDQIYGFVDRGERHVAIRPEMTPTLARMVAQVHREATKPLRWYAIPNLMRYEKPQRGRLREHWQFNCDVFGAPGRMGEIEIIQVAIALMESFGANPDHFEVLLNDRQIIEAVFKQIMKVDDGLAYKLIKIVDRSKKLSAEALEKQIGELGLADGAKKAFSEYLALNSFDGLLKYLLAHELPVVADEIAEVIIPLNKLGLLRYVKYDPSIARGLDYYTGVVFEIFDKHPENRRAICGGGAYAHLLKIFNEPSLPGVGFGLGDVTLTDFLTTHKLMPEGVRKPHNDLMLAADNAAFVPALMDLATKLRKHGLRVVTQLDAVKFNKVFTVAEKMGAVNVGLIGETEAKAGKIQIKNLASRTQTEINVTDADGIVKLIKAQLQ